MTGSELCGRHLKKLQTTGQVFCIFLGKKGRRGWAASGPVLLGPSANGGMQWNSTERNEISRESRPKSNAAPEIGAW